MKSLEKPERFLRKNRETGTAPNAAHERQVPPGSGVEGSGARLTPAKANGDEGNGARSSLGKANGAERLFVVAEGEGTAGGSKGLKQARAFQFGAFLLIVDERILLRDGERVPLTPKVFETLLILVENAGHIVQKETLIKRVWPDTNVQEDNLTFNISTLRKALGGQQSGQQFIKTEHKIGYRFVAPVRIVAFESQLALDLAPTFGSAGVGPNEGATGPIPGAGLKASATSGIGLAPESIGGEPAANERLGTDPLTRPAPADENAGGGPPSPPRGRGLDSVGGRGLESAGGRGEGSADGLGADPRVGPREDPSARIGLEIPPANVAGIEGGSSAGSAAALQGARRTATWVGLGLALLIVATGTVWLMTPAPEPKVVKSDQLTSDGRQKGDGLATDGARIFFIEQAPTGWVIAQVSASGGGPVSIAGTPMDSSVTDISPDHRELLVVQGCEFGPGTLEIVPLFGGEPRRLGNIRAYAAAWSPDGATLAYTNDDGINLATPDGSSSRRIASITGLKNKLHWSPDGGKLCFTRGEHSVPSLWEVCRDGKGLTRVFPESQSSSAGRYGLWIPSGKYLITDSVCAGNLMPSAIRLSPGLFDHHPGEPACLEFGPMGMRVSSVSPDGTRLFGLANPVGHPRMEEYDSHTREFKPFLPELSAQYADFSKDGQRIAYVTGELDVTDASCLWVSQFGSSRRVQITRPPLVVQSPRWSPDGNWIAFMGKDPGQQWRVRVVSADGGSYAPITPVEDQEGAPTWSPDSAQIAFGGMTQAAERTAGRLVIHMFNLKTRQLSDVPGSEGLWTARWSPNGQYICALTEDSRNLMFFDFHSGRWTKLATMSKIPDVVWSRHEEAIYFNGEVTAGDRAIFRMKIPGGRLERVASLAGRSDWDWLGLTPDDSPLIARNPVTQEIYALTVKWP